MITSKFKFRRAPTMSMVTIQLEHNSHDTTRQGRLKKLVPTSCKANMANIPPSKRCTEVIPDT
jgi:hypothetical protein